MDQSKYLLMHLLQTQGGPEIVTGGGRVDDFGPV